MLPMMFAARALRRSAHTYHSATASAVLWLGFVPIAWCTLLHLALHGSTWLANGSGHFSLWKNAFALILSWVLLPAPLRAGMNLVRGQAVDLGIYLNSLKVVPQALVTILVVVGPWVLGRALSAFPSDAITRIVSALGAVCSAYLFVRTLTWLPLVVDGVGTWHALRQAWRQSRKMWFSIALSLAPVGLLCAVTGLLEWHIPWLGMVLWVVVLPLQTLLWVSCAELLRGSRVGEPETGV